MDQARASAFREVFGGELSGRINQSGHLLLRYEIIYPRLRGTSPAENRVSRYHHNQAKAFERLIKNQYLPAAREQFKALSPSGSFEPFEITASFQAMHSSRRLLSLFTDTYMQLRHQGTRLTRSARTYDMEQGSLLLLPQLFSRGSLFRQTIFTALGEQIGAEADKNPGCYFSDWPRLYRQAVKESAYYLADDGIVIYFQENTIAGKNAGLPAFLLPYGLFEGQLQFGLQ